MEKHVLHFQTVEGHQRTLTIQAEILHEIGTNTNALRDKSLYRIEKRWTVYQLRNKKVVLHLTRRVVGCSTKGAVWSYNNIQALCEELHQEYGRDEKSPLYELRKQLLVKNLWTPTTPTEAKKTN